MKITYLLSFIIICFSSASDAAFKTETLVLDNVRLNVTHWLAADLKQTSNQDTTDKETVILLSGPTDNWNSDSAWFARLAPKLAQQYDVISIDRAGQIFADDNSELGYSNFGKHLLDALLELNLKRVKFISFASSNISLLKMAKMNSSLSESSQLEISKIILIDPDVLLPFSISRYSNDAKPFKANLAAYKKYILQGKYDQRALQKNQTELKHLKTLSGNDPDTNWSYVDLIFRKRLETKNITNLFEEIAMYEQDLKSVQALEFSSNIPLIIFDTDFEQNYINNAKTEAEKLGLTRWKNEAKKYYQSLATNSKSGKYIELATTEHLLPFSQPDIIIQSL